MSNERRFQEGRWDCSYCKVKSIRGRHRNCPGCGAPKDEDVDYYLLPNEPYVTDEDLIAQAAGDPDWICDNCKSCNDDNLKSCAGCGAPQSGKTVEVVDYALDQVPSSSPDEEKPRPSKTAKPKATVKVEEHEPDSWTEQVDWRKFLTYGSVGLGILLLVLLGFLFFKTHVVEARITGFNWQRSIEIQELRTLTEEDWSVPAGGRERSSRREIHHYDKILDHNETKTKQVPETVQTGTRTERYACGKRKTGNGYYETIYCTRSVPVYSTRYRTVTYQEPVYRKEPRYQTKYTYDIDRWVYDRTERAQGDDRNPHWPSYQLGPKQQESGRSQAYTVSFAGDEGATYSSSFSEDQWQSFDPNRTYKLRVNSFGIVLGLEN